ncbi:MAG: DNA repair protein RadC [Clostridia bacterium]|nr:DNA repair protein RadC [Clostridia bacterium]
MAEQIHSGHRSRLRESSYKNNFQNLEEHQLLELLLTYVIPRRDTNPIAHRLINYFGSFTAVLDAKIEDLVKIEGVGEKTANFLVSIKHFFYAYNKGKVKPDEYIKSPDVAAAYANRYFKGKTVEEFYVVCLEADCKVKHCELISTGSVNKTDVSTRKVLEIAFKTNASSVMVMHNHPEGGPEPSMADNKLTKVLSTVLAYNNIALVDHMIVSKKEYFSYKRNGLIDEYRAEFAKEQGYPFVMQNPCTYGDEE